MGRIVHWGLVALISDSVVTPQSYMLKSLTAPMAMVPEMLHSKETTGGKCVVAV